MTQTWVEKEDIFKADVFVEIQPEFTDPPNEFRQSVFEAGHTNDAHGVHWHHVACHLPAKQILFVTTDMFSN